MDLHNFISYEICECSCFKTVGFDFAQNQDLNDFFLFCINV